MSKKLAIVERDKDILHILTFVLEQEGYQVKSYQSESGVLEDMVSEKPDVVVLDIIQVSDEGTELCRKIKAMKEFENVPVIALSTHVNYKRIQEICADHVLNKPFNISDIIDAIDSQLPVAD